MRKPVQSAFFVLFLLVGVCIPLSVFARYEIILKGGNMIETDSYYEEGDIVKYHRFGTYIGIGKTAYGKSGKQKRLQTMKRLYRCRLI